MYNTVNTQDSIYLVPPPFYQHKYIYASLFFMLQITLSTYNQLPFFVLRTTDQPFSTYLRISSFRTTDQFFYLYTRAHLCSSHYT